MSEEFSIRQHWQEAEAREQDIRTPDEKAALEALHVGYQALVNLGWRDASYCPKDGSYFFGISAGSTAVVPMHYEGDWPKGTYWACCSGDLWPSRPILFKPATQLELDRFYGKAPLV
jgi:hypothetical protein